MVSELEFFIHALPRRVLSSNAPGEERVHWAISDAKMTLGDYTETALIPKHEPLPSFGVVRLFITGHIKVHAQPKLEDCTRCLHEYFQKPWQGSKRRDKTRAAPTCRCYRATDPSNLGGETTKPIPDRLKALGIITDDNYQYVDAAVFRIQPVAEIADEGVHVLVQEVS